MKVASNTNVISIFRHILDKENFSRKHTVRTYDARGRLRSVNGAPLSGAAPPSTRWGPTTHLFVVGISVLRSLKINSRRFVPARDIRKSRLFLREKPIDWRSTFRPYFSIIIIFAINFVAVINFLCVARNRSIIFSTLILFFCCVY